MRNSFVLFTALFISLNVFSQSGGDNVYDFLNLTNSARVAALGGQQISIFDDDLNLAFHNPSLLNGSMSNQLVLNYVPFFDEIKFGYASYARTIEGLGNFAAGIHYVDYGSFQRADETGNRDGNFYANEYSVNFMYSRPILDSVFHVGGAMKFLISQLETYNSFGMAIDAGVTYYSTDKLFAAAFVMKNFGAQITTYYEGGDHEPLPFEIQFGISQKLQHAPFRLSVLARNLETPNLRYKSELDIQRDIDPLTGETKEDSKLASAADNVMRHLIFGIEFVPAKFLSAQVGYNYKRRQEMKIYDLPGSVGFSWGLGLNFHKFRIAYGRASIHKAGASSHLSLTIKINEFGKKY